MRFFLFYIFFTVSSFILGQEKPYQLNYISSDFSKFIKHPKQTFKDSIEIKQYLKTLQSLAIKKGYLTMSIDKVLYKGKEVDVYIHLGREMRQIKLKANDDILFFLRKTGKLNEKLLNSFPFSPNEMNRLLNRIHKAYADNGYPFLSIQLINHQWNEEIPEAEIKIIQGPLIKISKIHIKGDSSISEKLILNIIGIRKGEAYNETKISHISEKLNQINFLTELQAPAILFTKEGAELFIYLKSKPVSSVNGVIGFQPNPITKRLSITGELDLHLVNILRRGEELSFKWRSIREQTQSLNIQFDYPFLFNTSFGISSNLSMYKRDSSFLELNYLGGINYFLPDGTILKAFWKRNSSNILSGGKNNPSYSFLGNTENNRYGIGLKKQQLDYIPNPSRGFEIDINTEIGTRKGQINDSSEIHKDLTYSGQLKLYFYLPINQRNVLKLGNNTSVYTSPEIYENELFRFGGLNNQRGFNENELLASTKTTFTLEYRFLLDKNSHIFAFFDQTWYENNAVSYVKDTPFGFGTGFSFSTKIGLFSISYALGKQFSNPILIKDGKIHFGYIFFF